MNEVRLFGTLTKDPNIRHAEREDGYDVARFTIRADQGERDDGKSYTDNINVVAFRKVAELVEKKRKKDMDWYLKWQERPPSVSTSWLTPTNCRNTPRSWSGWA